MSGKQLILLVLAFVGLAAAFDAFFIVDQRQKALLFQLGEVKKADIPPGIHFKVPFAQNVRLFDSRILTMDTKAEEYLTLEKKQVQVDFFVKWRIDDVREFYRATGGNESTALARLSSIINKGLRDEFGNRTIQQAVSGERNEIMRSLEANAADKVGEFGMELIDVRVKRIDLPQDVSNSVYERMRSERQRVAADFRARGAEEAEKIKANADREREVILANAYREAQQVRGKGDAQAADIYAQAYEQDREFYQFYRSLDVYTSSFGDGGDLLVLEPDSEVFQYFRKSKGQ